MKKFSIYVFILILISFFSFSCHKEVTKEEHVFQIEKTDTIPPGHAQITGRIIEVEPVSSNKSSSGPCSKAPCTAKVEIEYIKYGTGFPVLSNNVIKIRFAFTLSKTTKELFPNMNESYPGLKAGDEFDALLEYSENARIGNENSDNSVYTVNGYKINK